MPILNVSVKDVNSKTVALTGDDSVLVKHHSDALATMTMQYGEIIEPTCIIENGENEVKEVSSTTFENVENNYFLFKCENTQFIHFKKELYAPMINYFPLTCSIASVTFDGSGKATVECYGKFFNGSFGAVENEIFAQCCYKVNGEYSEWHEMYVTYAGDTYYASVDFEDLDYEQGHSFEVEVYDALEEARAKKTASSKPLFHWGRDDFTFEVPVNAKDIRLKSDGKNYGHYLRFGDGDYCYIAEPSDDSLVIFARNDIDLNTQDGNVYINGSLVGGTGASGTWTPALDSGAVSYATRQGWYCKNGNVVTVGFYIKATCNSGYEDTTITIYNLPFDPICDSAGGGMCSGAYISGGYNFQCFVAETDGTITTRVQACNNTSDTNLSTSASGCNYRSGGGSLTLSGTITYFTYE